MLVGLAAQVLVLHGHLHGDLHAHRATVRIEDVVEPFRGNAHQFPCQPIGGFMGQPA